jgi:hypothetical protein
MEKVFFKEEVPMTEITLHLEPAVLLFYDRIATAVGKSLEQVLTDALFKLAGELSLEALKRTE